MKDRSLRWWIAGLAAWFTALGLAAPFDLEAAVALYNPSHPMARVVERYGEWPAWVLLLLALAVLAVKGPAARRFRPLAVVLVVLVIVEPLVVTQTLKHLWGRVRFRDLAPGFADYTPFFVPAGAGAGESFPSGHVAMAWPCCTCAFWLSGGRGALLCWIAVLAYGLIVWLGRMLAGAHYLTDCLFSAGLDLLLGFLLVAKARARLTEAVPSRPGGATP